jgi:hypothetical protein
MTWNGFAQERHAVTYDASRDVAIRAPVSSTTAAWTRCRDSTTAPRVTTTSNSNDFIEDGERIGAAATVER